MIQKNILFSLFAFLLSFSFVHTIYAKSSDNHTVTWIKNIHSDIESQGVKIFWNLEYDSLASFKEQNKTISIAYIDQSKVKKSQEDQGVEGWTTIEEIDIMETEYSLQDLTPGKTYQYRIGLQDAQSTTWSKTLEAETESPWGWFNMLTLLGSLAMFLYGMKIMGEGLQQAAGSNLRNVLGSITSNPFKGVLTGLGITTLMQSSSVTTVMTVSFVNAGILTLYQSAGVVMGANIGTTITAWIIDLFGFKVDIGPYTLIMLAIGLPLLFLNSPKSKGWAQTIIGFAFLFMGLGFLKDSVPTVAADSSFVQFFTMLNSIPILSIIIFVLFGCILTVIIQSSSATVALTMTLLASGAIPFEAAAAMVLGENIGTTITAELAATVGNVHAKRTARIHSTFNVTGVIWAVLTFPLFLKLVVFLTEQISGGNPMEEASIYGSTGLAILHTTFNVTNVFIMIWFIPAFVKFAERTVQAKSDKDELFQLDYIGRENLLSPHLSILEVKKELAKFGKLTGRMSMFTKNLLVETNRKNQNELLERIKKYEDITDQVEVEIANYLNLLSIGNMDKDLAVRIQGMNRIANNLERIGDIFYQISLLIHSKNEGNLLFSEKQEDRIIEMLDLLDEAFVIMNTNLDKHSAQVTLKEAQEMEEKINCKRDEIRKEYYNDISEDEQYNIKSAIVYSNIFNLLERVGDHIINVTEGLMGEI